MKHVTTAHTATLAYPLGDRIDLLKKYVQESILAFARNINPELRYQEVRRINLFCRGSSGAMTAALFAGMCPWKCKIIHIKKDGEKSHHSHVEFNRSLINVIIDDFIGMGETVKAIYDALPERTHIDVVIVQRGWSEHMHTIVGFKPDYILSR